MQKSSTIKVVKENIWDLLPAGLVWDSDWKIKKPCHFFSGFGCRSKWQTWHGRKFAHQWIMNVPQFPRLKLQYLCLLLTHWLLHAPPHKQQPDTAPCIGFQQEPSWVHMSDSTAPCLLFASQSYINGLLSFGADALSANVCFMHANEKTSKNRFMFGSAQR